MNINIYIDINMNIDIHITSNMNIEDYKRYHLLIIRYSLLGIPYWVFPIGYSLLGIYIYVPYRLLLVAGTIDYTEFCAAGIGEQMSTQATPAVSLQIHTKNGHDVHWNRNADRSVGVTFL